MYRRRSTLTCHVLITIQETLFIRIGKIKYNSRNCFITFITACQYDLHMETSVWTVDIDTNDMIAWHSGWRNFHKTRTPKGMIKTTTDWMNREYSCRLLWPTLNVTLRTNTIYVFFVIWKTYFFNTKKRIDTWHVFCTAHPSLLCSKPDSTFRFGVRFWGVSAVWNWILRGFSIVLGSHWFCHPVW